jgi:molybdenum cofactor cytidylyltransferase
MSTRMGRTKATLRLTGGETFVGRIIRTFHDAGVHEIIVVLGHDATAVASAVYETGLGARVVLNRDYEAGQLSSVLAGLAVVDRPGVQGLLLTLVDVPLVGSATIRAVLDRHRELHPPVVRPVQGNRHGHPILLDRSLFDRIRAADPAHGLKPVVRVFASAQGDVAVEDEGAFVDIDTPDEYARLTAGEPAG